MVMTADLIMFAIQSAIRLGQQARQAYVDSTRNRALALPLPNFNPEPNPISALEFYRRLPNEEIPRSIRKIVREAQASTSPRLSVDESNMVLAYYNEHRMRTTDAWKTIKPSPEGGFMTPSSVEALVTIRQWDREARWQESEQFAPGGAPGPSPLQRVAGTIVELGVDYFAQVPGALNPKTRNGKAIYAVLSALDRVEFADKSLGDLPTRLFVATLEGVAQNSKLLTSDEETRTLLSVLSLALARDVAERIAKLGPVATTRDAERKAGIVHWAEFVFRSILSSGGRIIASDPRSFLGIDDTGNAALVTKVGESVLDFVLKLPEGELHRAFGLGGLNVVVSSVLRVVGEHPEIVLRTDANGKVIGASAEGLKNLCADIATELGSMPRLLYRPALIPEIVRLVLEKTGRNLPVLWPGQSDSPMNLLLVAARKALEILSQEPSPEARWKLRFSDADLMSVTEAVLDAFVEAPGWLLDQTGKANENYRSALQAALEVLRQRGDPRLSSGLSVAVLRSALRTTALRQEFLEDVAGGKLLVAAAIDAVLAPLFPSSGLDPKAAVVLLRREIIATLVEESLQALAQADLTAPQRPQCVKLLQDLVEDHISRILQGKGWNMKIFLAELELILRPGPGAAQPRR